jgi:luciferase family oxidoreductase group 1
MRALRRDIHSADTFPHDVLELQGYLSDETRVAGVNATPGKGTNVPLYILGSSLFGARLAAVLGLPYAFASHFAPAALADAVAVYRAEFTPSGQLAEPYVIAGVNVLAADDTADADDQFRTVTRYRVARFLGGDGEFTDGEIDQLLASPQGRHVVQMMRYSAVGTADHVRRYLDEFTAHSDADELIVVHASPTLEQRLRSVDLLADASGLTESRSGPEAVAVTT